MAHEAKLDRCQMHSLAVPGGLAFFQVDDRGFKRQHAVTRAGPHGVAQGGTYSRQQFARAERLGDVVIGARIERLDLGALLRARRQHDDRHRRPFADAPDDSHPVEIRQPQVEDHEVGLVRSRVDRTAACGFGFHHPVAFRAERRAQDPPDPGLIFDNQNDWIPTGHITRRQFPAALEAPPRAAA